MNEGTNGHGALYVGINVIGHPTHPGSPLWHCESEPLICRNPLHVHPVVDIIIGRHGHMQTMFSIPGIVISEDRGYPAPVLVIMILEDIIDYIRTFIFWLKGHFQY